MFPRPSSIMNNQYYAPAASACASAAPSRLSSGLSILTGSSCTSSSSSSDELIVATTTSSAASKKTKKTKPRGGSRRVRFLPSLVSHEKSCPKTLPWHIRKFFYSQKQTDQFRTESEDHCNEYNELVNMGASAAIDCLAAFPDDPTTAISSLTHLAEVATTPILALDDDESLLLVGEDLLQDDSTDEAATTNNLILLSPNPNSDLSSFSQTDHPIDNSGLAEKKKRVKSRLLRELESILDGRYWRGSGERGARR